MTQEQEVKELVNLLERVYPLVVGGIRGTHRCSDGVADEVQDVLSKHGRWPRPATSFSDTELKEILA